jgi:hypothetical protein
MIVNSALVYILHLFFTIFIYLYYAVPIDYYAALSQLSIGC